MLESQQVRERIELASALVVAALQRALAADEQRFPLVCVVPVTGTPGEGLLYPPLAPGQRAASPKSHLRGKRSAPSMRGWRSSWALATGLMGRARHRSSEGRQLSRTRVLLRSE